MYFVMILVLVTFFIFLTESYIIVKINSYMGSYIQLINICFVFHFGCLVGLFFLHIYFFANILSCIRKASMVLG